MSVTDDVAPDPVRLKQRRAAAHKGIGNGHALETVRTIIAILHRRVAKLREQQPTEQRPRTPREPLTNRDDRAIVLLNLLFTQREATQ